MPASQPLPQLWVEVSLSKSELATVLEYVTGLAKKSEGEWIDQDAERHRRCPSSVGARLMRTANAALDALQQLFAEAQTRFGDASRVVVNLLLAALEERPPSPADLRKLRPEQASWFATRFHEWSIQARTMTDSRAAERLFAPPRHNEVHSEATPGRSLLAVRTEQTTLVR